LIVLLAQDNRGEQLLVTFINPSMLVIRMTAEAMECKSAGLVETQICIACGIPP